MTLAINTETHSLIETLLPYILVPAPAYTHLTHARTASHSSSLLIQQASMRARRHQQATADIDQNIVCGQQGSLPTYK